MLAVAGGDPFVRVYDLRKPSQARTERDRERKREGRRD
jgi:hypothetical protein